MPIYKLTDVSSGVSVWILAGSPEHAQLAVAKVLRVDAANRHAFSCQPDNQRNPLFGFIEHGDGQLTEIPWDLKPAQPL